METISLNMIVKNEGKVLSRCLSSVINLVDEIIIVDTGSEDDTVEIAKSFGAKTFTYHWNDNFAEARNYSLSKSICDWHLVMDADEFIVKGSKEDISDFLKFEDKHIGLIKLIDKYFMNGVDQHSVAYLSRIFPKGTQYNGMIHEQMDCKLAKFKTSLEIYHDGYYLKNKSERNIVLLETIIQEEKEVDPYLYFQIAKEYRLSGDYKKAQKYYLKSYYSANGFNNYNSILVVDFIYNIIRGRYFEEGLKIISEEKHKLANYPDFHLACGLFYMELVFSNTEKFIEYFPLIEKTFIRALEIGEIDDFDGVIGAGSFLPAYNLGAFYEAMGNIEQARKYYRISASADYQLAKDRLNKMCT